MEFISELYKISLDYTAFDFNLLKANKENIKYFNHDDEGSLYIYTLDNKRIYLGFSKVDIVTESENEKAFQSLFKKK